MSILDILHWFPVHPSARPYDTPPICTYCKGDTHTYAQLVKCVTAARRA